MTTDSNKTLVRELYASLMARGDVEAANQILSPDYVDHDIPGLGEGGRDHLAQAVLGVRAAFPDVMPELYDLVAEGDLVAVRVEASGTHMGEAFLGIPPAGKPIRWREQHTFRCADGRIVEHRGVFDLLAILQQLGAIPSPA